jgi:hypothetical protein
MPDVDPGEVGDGRPIIRGSAQEPSFTRSCWLATARRQPDRVAHLEERPACPMARRGAAGMTDVAECLVGYAVKQFGHLPP